MSYREAPISRQETSTPSWVKPLLTLILLLRKLADRLSEHRAQSAPQVVPLQGPLGPPEPLIIEVESQAERQADPPVPASAPTTLGEHWAATLVDSGGVLPLPDPLQMSRAYKGSGFADAQLSLLIARYANARGDLIVCAHDIELAGDATKRAYAQRVLEHLKAAKDELEKEGTNPLVVSNLLSLAEASLMWLYPGELLKDRCELVKESLAAQSPRPAALIKQLGGASCSGGEASEGADFRVRQTLTVAATHLSQAAETLLLEDNLQVRRLTSVRRYLVAGLALLLAAVPFSVQPTRADGVIVWPVFTAELGLPVEWLVLIGAAALGAVGAVGGIVSGMLRVRDSRTSLSDYRTSLLTLSLRPLIGAIAAISLYLLLSWETVPGIEVSNPGMFLLTAFTAGFSERYFLGVLRREDARVRTAATKDQQG